MLLGATPRLAGVRAMRRFSVSPLDAVRSLVENRGLILAMAQREVAGRYRGAFAGLFWIVVNPLLMLAAFTFVFGVVFQARWPGMAPDKTQFAVAVFAGMIIYNVFAECVNRAPSMVLDHPNYVKKVIFPLEILPWVSLGVALFHFCAGLTVWLAFNAWVNGVIHVTALLLPVVLLPLLLGILGLCWFLASLGVYVRDIGQAVGIITTLMMFLSPIFFPASMLPSDYRLLAQINPLGFVIEQAREVLIHGRLPDWSGLALFGAVGAALAWLGFAWFQRTRRGFADVL